MSNQLAPSAEHAANVVVLPIKPRGLEQEPTDQRAAAGICKGEGGINSGHAVRYCVSVPFFRRRFYLALLIGSEKRSSERIAVEANDKPWWHTTFSISALVMFASTLLMSTLATAYLLKSMLGIDLMESNFFMHAWFFN